MKELGIDLVNATNPENGTLTYTYDGAHHVTQKTDAKGQQVLYSCDQYGRLTEVHRYAMYNGVLTEQVGQMVKYYYDFERLGLGVLSEQPAGGGWWWWRCMVPIF